MKILLLALSFLCLNSAFAQQSDFKLNVFGQCIQVSTGQMVQQNKCQTLARVDYKENAYGQCIQVSTGQIVQSNKCEKSISTENTQRCFGDHSYNGQVYQCGILNNCSGYTMISMKTGKLVYCQ